MRVAFEYKGQDVVLNIPKARIEAILTSHYRAAIESWQAQHANLTVEEIVAKLNERYNR